MTGILSSVGFAINVQLLLTYACILLLQGATIISSNESILKDFEESPLTAKLWNATVSFRRTTSTPTTKSPTHETEETTKRQTTVFHTRPNTSAHSHFIDANFWPIQPTRWPLSTHKPKISATTTPKPKSSSTKRMTPTLTSVTATTATTPYDPKMIGVFVCPPVQGSAGVIYKCKHAESDAGPVDGDDCSNGGIIGTKATLTCAKFYKPAFAQDSIEIDCQSNHRWSTHRNFACTLECGIAAKPVKSYIVSGIASNRIAWPWHSTIFRRKGEEFYYICGGTLISKSLILTAAHCVTDPGTATIWKRNEFKLILASKTSNYTANLIDKISGANLFTARNITIPVSYNGLTLESDIALIQLDREVELSDFVKPICFPFQSKENSDIEQLHLSPGTLGQTVGFGIDETGNASIGLREIRLPVISHKECGEVLDRFPTHSQFCAGYRNGSSVCTGDSGGGIFFSEGTGISNRFMIQGVVSFGYSKNREARNDCSQKTFAVLTKVGGFAAWVQQFMDKWEPEN